MRGCKVQRWCDGQMWMFFVAKRTLFPNRYSASSKSSLHLNRRWSSRFTTLPHDTNTCRSFTQLRKTLDTNIWNFAIISYFVNHHLLIANRVVIVMLINPIHRSCVRTNWICPSLHLSHSILCVELYIIMIRFHLGSVQSTHNVLPLLPTNSYSHVARLSVLCFSTYNQHEQHHHPHRHSAARRWGQYGHVLNDDRHNRVHNSCPTINLPNSSSSSS